MGERMPRVRYYQTQVRVPRLRALRAILFTRRGLVLTVRVSGDGDFIATANVASGAEREPRWRSPDEEWRP